MLPTSTAQVTQSLDEHEDVVSWINASLDDSHQPSDLTELERRVAALLATVGVACEDTSAQLDRVIDDVSRGVPRLTYDLQFARDGAQALQTALDGARARSDAVPAETAHALERLRFLDAAKRNMEAAREVLREAESWSTLESEVTSLLSERSYAKAAERLSEASRSMVVFENTPEYDSRRTLMVSLQNQLEASLSSALVAAITSQDLTMCREYFSIFSNIQRESEFRNYYNGSRRASLVTMWQTTELVEGEPNETDAAQTFSEFLFKFYGSFLSLLDMERTCVPSIFPDPPFTLSALITSVLSALQPTFSQRLTAVLNHHGPKGLKEIISAFRATEEFAASAEKIMEKLRLASLQQSPKTDGAPWSKNRRHFARMSSSWRSTQRASIGEKPGAFSMSSASYEVDWNQELFQPFLDLQTDYGALERRLLDEELDETVSAGGSVEADRARLLRDRSTDVCRVGEQAVARCAAFTHGYGAVGLVRALDGFFKAFVEMWTAELVVRRVYATNDVTQRLGPPLKGGDDLSELDYTEEDWAAVQNTIHLLGATRVASERMMAFEGKLCGTLAGGLGDAPGTQQLRQSTLNSAELHALLLTPDETAPIQLSEARTAVSALARACQAALQETLLAPLRRHLAGYAALPAWTARKAVAAAVVGELQIPSFSLSPTEVMQRVAEGLLNLPRLFEVYADDDALAFSLQTLPHADGGDEELGPVGGGSGSGGGPEAVSAAWLASSGHAVLTHFTGSVLPSVRALSATGVAQLSADLAYLGNVVRALGVRHAPLERWREAVEVADEEEWRRRRAEGDEEMEGVLKQVARMRGWRV